MVSISWLNETNLITYQDQDPKTTGCKDIQSLAV